jgi:hypothetical protein
MKERRPTLDSSNTLNLPEPNILNVPKSPVIDRSKLMLLKSPKGQVSSISNYNSQISVQPA